MSVCVCAFNNDNLSSISVGKYTVVVLFILYSNILYNLIPQGYTDLIFNGESI